MQVHNVNLTISAVRPEQYPDAKLPEVALFQCWKVFIN